MEITRMERAALITTGAAAAYKTLLWSLEASVDSQNIWIVGLRIVFALLSFAAFDLVLMAVIERGWSISGAVALIVAAGVSGAIGLAVGRGATIPELHAAPAITLAAFGLHLMLSRPAVEIAPLGNVTNTQINIGALPRTFADFAAARAAELPSATPAQLAIELGTGEATIRKLLDLAGVTINQAQQEG